MNTITDRLETDLYNDTAKAYITAADLNRIEGNIKKIAEKVDVSIVTKTTWSQSDIFTMTDSDRIINNISTLIELTPGYAANIEIPKSFDKMTIYGLNNIEMAIKELDLSVWEGNYLYPLTQYADLISDSNNNYYWEYAQSVAGIYQNAEFQFNKFKHHISTGNYNLSLKAAVLVDLQGADAYGTVLSGESYIKFNGIAEKYPHPFFTVDVSTYPYPITINGITKSFRYIEWHRPVNITTELNSLSVIIVSDAWEYDYGEYTVLLQDIKLEEQ